MTTSAATRCHVEKLDTPFQSLDPPIISRMFIDTTRQLCEMSRQIIYVKRVLFTSRPSKNSPTDLAAESASPKPGGLFDYLRLNIQAYSQQCDTTGDKIIASAQGQSRFSHI